MICILTSDCCCISNAILDLSASILALLSTSSKVLLILDSCSDLIRSYTNIDKGREEKRREEKRRVGSDGMTENVSKIKNNSMLKKKLCIRY